MVIEVGMEDYLERRGLFKETIEAAMVVIVEITVIFLLCQLLFNLISKPSAFSHISYLLKHLSKDQKDEMEIIQAVSNEVDEGLKDDIDDEMEGEDSEEKEELKQSKIIEIPSEGIFQRIEPWVKNMLKKNSFNNYKHYFGSYSAGMTNLFVVIVF